MKDLFGLFVFSVHFSFSLLSLLLSGSFSNELCESHKSISFELRPLACASRLRFVKPVA